MENKIMGVLNLLLDDRIDLFGRGNTILYLLDNGFTKEELVKIGFDEEEIDYVVEHIDDEYLDFDF